MSKISKIQWTDGSWNPWHGCKQVSPGCKYCYMFRDKNQYGQVPTVVNRSKTRFDAPFKWDEPKLIFTCSWSDWFIEDADEWRDEAWEVIRDTPQHTYQILTKRPERIRENLPEWFDEISDRVLLGVSIEGPGQVDRLDYLRGLPCKNFASFEPLIAKVQWDERMCDLDWVIIGGESGNDNGQWIYRPMALDWMEHLLKNSKGNHVPCFIKQLGTHQSKQLKLHDRHGGKMEEWPNHLKVREFPK